MRRVLITRPIDDAAPLVESLSGRGVEAMVEPMMTIRSTEEPLPDLEGAQGLLFTSANGVRGFMTRSDRRDIPVFAVGEATGEAARRAGFETVSVAGGDVVALAGLVQATCKPEAGKLIHVAGTHVAGDLSERLTKAGFTLERAVLYDALSAHQFSTGTVEALKRAEVEAVMLFSPRTAEIFMTLVDQSGGEKGLSKMAAICLSQAVANRLPADRFRAIVVAAKPDQPAMLDALDRAMPAEDLASSGAEPRVVAVKGPGMAALVFTGMLSVLTTLALLALTVDQWRPMFFPVTASDSEAAIAALNRRVATLEAQKPAPAPAPAAAALPADLLDRIARLEKQVATAPTIASTGSAPAAPAPAPVDLAPLEGRIAALEARPTPTPFDPSSILDQLARIGDRLGRSEQKVSEGESRYTAAEATAGKRIALALGLAQISDLARAGMPFQAQLTQIGQASDATLAAVIKTLEGLAQRGAPTLEQLRAKFPEAAKKALTASFAVESGDLIGELRAALARAITVRRVDVLGSEGDDPESRLARAEALLANGDLAGALAQIEKLPAQALAAITDWVAPAKDRLSLDAAMRELSAAILRLRSGG